MPRGFSPQDEGPGMNQMFGDLAANEASRKASEHRINYGRLWPDTLYKADCTCGWSFGKATRDSVIAAVRYHEDNFCK